MGNSVIIQGLEGGDISVVTNGFFHTIDERFVRRGKSPDFISIWDSSEQAYTIYYKGKFFMRKFRMLDVEPYLN